MAFQKREKKTIARNKAARHEYFVDETFEAGLALTGTEVKSLRERACQITDAFCLIPRAGGMAARRAHPPVLKRRRVER